MYLCIYVYTYIYLSIYLSLSIYIYIYVFRRRVAAGAEPRHDLLWEVEHVPHLVEAALCFGTIEVAIGYKLLLTLDTLV